MANKIQLRRDTAANWARINPILADGELGLDITNNKVKAGDGTTEWSSLPYVAASAQSQLVNGNKVLSVASNGAVTMPGNITLPGSTVLSSVTGNSNITTPIGSDFNINTNDGSARTFKFSNNGVLTLPNNSAVDAAGSDLYMQTAADGEFTISTAVTNGTTNYWRFGTNGNLTLPPNGVITTTQGYTGNSFDITNVTSANPAVVTTNGDHALTSGTNILITNITTMTELNGREFYVTTPSSSSLALYEDPNCTIPVDSSLYTAYNQPGGYTLTELGGTLTFHNENPVTNPTGTANSMVFWNNQLVVPGNGDFSIGPSVDFTIEAYMNFTDNDVNNGYAPLFGSTHGWLGISILTGPTSMGIFTGYNGGAWIGGSFYVDPVITPGTWHHVAFVRDSGKIRLYIDGTKVTANGGDHDNDTTDFTNAGDSTIGRAVGYNCQGTLISNFRYTVGTALYTSNFSRPTSPLTAVTGTKLLIIGDNNFTDYSGAVMQSGGGTLLSEYAGADLTIALDSPGNTDPGSIILVSKNIALRVNGRDNQLELNNPGGVYPINSSGQHTITLAYEGTSATYTNIPTNCNLIYIQPNIGHDSGGVTHTVNIDYPTRPGIEMTIINDSEYSVSIDTMDTPPYVMVAWENIKLMSFRWPGDNQCYWWITDSFSWNY